MNVTDVHTVGELSPVPDSHIAIAIFVRSCVPARSMCSLLATVLKICGLLISYASVPVVPIMPTGACVSDAATHVFRRNHGLFHHEYCPRRIGRSAAEWRTGVPYRLVAVCLRRVQAALVVVGHVITATAAAAANYSLELVSPRAAGTAASAGLAVMPSGHRIFKAYPGLPYNIRAVVTGGAYPFTFSLANAPSGMTINRRDR